MSLKARLTRAKQGLILPNIYLNLEAQAKEIIKHIKSEVRGTNSYYDAIPATWKEWDRLRKNNKFKNEARHEFIYSFDAFVDEFGMCPEGTKRLTKKDKTYKEWNKHTTHWK